MYAKEYKYLMSILSYKYNQCISPASGFIKVIQYFPSKYCDPVEEDIGYSLIDGDNATGIHLLNSSDDNFDPVWLKISVAPEKNDTVLQIHAFGEFRFRLKIMKSYGSNFQKQLQKYSHVDIHVRPTKKSDFQN